jgi:endo-1,4-beta-mannosidase
LDYIKKALRKKFFLYVIGLILLVSFGWPIHYRIFKNTRPPWIKVTLNSFIKDNKPFKFIGANAVNLVFYDDWDLDIEKAIRTAKENKISVLRCYIDWGWGKDEDIDRILDIASRNGIYVILTLTDCCCSGDYPNLKKYFEVHAPFCNITNSYSINAFKKRIKEVIERRNSINGRIYRDDPTIFAWEIANELEYQHFSKADVHRWIEDIAGYIKSLDKKHLLTIGINADSSEFDSESSLYEMFDVAILDFFSFHFYASGDFSTPQKVVALSDEYLGKIEFHTKKFLSMGKPVIMGEFGLNDSIGSNFKIKAAESYIHAFKKCMDTAFSAGASGVMFWGWGIPEEKNVPMWWSQEGHSIIDESFCSLLKEYQINRDKTLPTF